MPITSTPLLSSTLKRAVAGISLVTLSSVCTVALATPTRTEASPLQASSTPEPILAPAIGVIDVGKVVDQYPVYIKLRTGLGKNLARYQQQIDDKTEKLKALRMTVQSIREDAPERPRAEHEYKKAVADDDFLRKQFSDLYAADELRMMLQVYEDLDYAIAKVAGAAGVSMVLPRNDILRSPTPIANMPIRELQRRVTAFRNRPVWFAGKELDLTGDVIKFMQVPLPERTSPERAAAQPIEATRRDNGARKGK